MEIDTSNLTDEQISKLNEFIHTMEEENKETKWWVMPKYSVLDNAFDYNQFGPRYQVEPQEDMYSRSRPPLKTGFNSRKEAEEWLSNYLREDDLFSKAKDTVDYIIDKLNNISSKFRDHEYVCSKDWKDCLQTLSTSLDHGTLKEVIKDNEKD